MRASVATTLDRLVSANNRMVQGRDPVVENPRPLDGCGWHHELVRRHPEIAGEWQRFAERGGRLPRIEDVLGEGQGNVGAWRVGVLWSGGAALPYARRRFPATVAAVETIPGLRAALWSVIDAGTVLTEHRGPNAGVLRYHLGVDCPTGSTLRVGDVEIPYTDAHGILFDDTARHAAWNRSAAPRVTLFCEVDRPLGTPFGLVNSIVQHAIGGGRRRAAVARSNEWFAALNPSRDVDG